ncbi:hypothetical protein Tsubulata_050182 [Turnera subulata]|uniref:DUF4219 domain-containing protein n=1 Tax=Turnera subulata TaxID=218843 RepID=A0A9Q0J1J7_9ROSI|nr:hypothetical protein Tsubulata_050182 [Turnera subulata]
MMPRASLAPATGNTSPAFKQAQRLGQHVLLPPPTTLSLSSTVSSPHSQEPTPPPASLPTAVKAAASLVVFNPCVLPLIVDEPRCARLGMATPTHVVPNAVMILKDLGEETYKNWTACMMAYLKAQDLWDVVMYTNYIHRDQQTYRDWVQNMDWSKKNAAALLAIITSCAPEILSKNRDISEAAVAWKKLEDLIKEQQQQIQQQMPELALSTNNCEPNNNGNDQLMDHKTWRDKNAMALRAIHASCAPTIPPQLVGVTSAKIAWETLAKLDQFKQRGITPSDPRYSNPLLDFFPL